MDTDYSIEQRTYQHITLEGTAYEAGRLQGEIHKTDPRFAFFCSAVDFNPEQYGYNSLGAMQAALERACPGLNEEIQGFVDACGVPVEKAFHYMASSAAVGGCSRTTWAGIYRTSPTFERRSRTGTQLPAPK